MTKNQLHFLTDGDVFWLQPSINEHALVVNDSGDLLSLLVPIPCQVVNSLEFDAVDATFIRAKNLRSGEHIFAEAQRSHFTYEACLRALQAQMKTHNRV